MGKYITYFSSMIGIRMELRSVKENSINFFTLLCKTMYYVNKLFALFSMRKAMF